MNRLCLLFLLVIAEYGIAAPAQEGSLETIREFLSNSTDVQFEHYMNEIPGNAVAGVLTIGEVSQSTVAGVSLVYGLFDFDGSYYEGKPYISVVFPIATEFAIDLGKHDIIVFKGNMLLGQKVGDTNRIDAVRFDVYVTEVTHNGITYLRNNEEYFTLDWSVVE